MMLELRPVYSGQKSYHGKAKVIVEGGVRRLYSYDTAILEYHSGENGVCLKKLWDGYSPTTMMHINDFMYQLGFATMSKKEWLEWEVNKYD